MKNSGGQLKNKTIAFIGGGRMARALIGGLKKIEAHKILVSEPQTENRHKVKNAYPRAAVFFDNVRVLETDVLILAVKPQIIKEIATAIGPKISPKVLVISIAAGIPLGWLEKMFPRNPVVRVMPNNPAQIGKGISALCPGKRAGAIHKKLAGEIFDSVGRTLWVAESFMNLITAISGSGPAFFYFFVDALAEAGTKSGLPIDDALELAIQTGLGSMKMLEHTGLNPKELIGQVTSPGGTTQAGIKVMEEGGFRGLVAKTIAASARRAKELSQV